MLVLLIAAVIPIGATPDLKPLTASVDDAGYHDLRTRVVVVGGGVPELDSSKFAVAAIPDAPASGYPPAGTAYVGPHAAQHYVWRFIQMHAPDLVVGPAELVRALAGSGIEVVEVGAPVPSVGPSSVRREMQRRLGRTPRQVAGVLSAHYGHNLPDVVYIPAMALVGRIRMGAMADVERIVAPYLERAATLPAKVTGSHLSGHLVFAELARRTGKSAYSDLVRRVADLGDFEGPMPHHDEMSDAVFMGTPILAEAGRLTGETRYFDRAIRHMEYMLKLNLRPDGLHRHSPLSETAWGRGNGFPALGLAWTLDAMPADYAGRRRVLEAFQRHMEALHPHQDATGMWHQIIDRPESYRELSATCMIGYAMLRGIRSGWLEAASYGPLIRRAWEAVNARIADDGSLFDVCAGTGKQKTQRAYFERPAIQGKDDRGGAMALLFAVEMMMRE
jgi:rhamnogalacturonyl hydrolase YesR